MFSASIQSVVGLFWDVTVAVQTRLLHSLRSVAAVQFLLIW